VPISIVITRTYKHGGRMITIGRIPRKLQGFFKPVKREVSGHLYRYLWSVVSAIRTSNGSTIERLAKTLRNSTHRTNHSRFLWRSPRNSPSVMRQIALDMPVSLSATRDRHLFLVIDDTWGLKRAGKMDAAGRLKHRMRRIVWMENVQDVIKHSHKKRVNRRLEKLLAA